MKFKDWLRKLAEQAKITDTDFEALLGASGIAELEVTDEFVEKFDGAYLTRDRAENDPEIIKKNSAKFKAEVLDGIDGKIGALLERIPEKDADTIKNEKNTFKKLELVASSLESVISNVKSKDQDLRKVEEEWANKNKQLVETHKKELEDLQKTMRETTLNSVLKGKIQSYNFSEAYAKLKEPTADIIINQLRAQQHEGKPLLYELDSAGNVNVRQETEGGLRDVYVKGNEKLTLERLLDPLLDPFIKKSDVGKNGDGTKTKAVTPPVDFSKMTLEEMRKAQFAANGQ